MQTKRWAVNRGGVLSLKACKISPLEYNGDESKCDAAMRKFIMMCLVGMIPLFPPHLPAAQT